MSIRSKAVETGYLSEPSKKLIVGLIATEKYKLKSIYNNTANLEPVRRKGFVISVRDPQSYSTPVVVNLIRMKDSGLEDVNMSNTYLEFSQNQFRNSGSKRILEIVLLAIDAL